MENKETFKYVYSADDQEEIKKIRNKYTPSEEDKMSKLRRLDVAVTKKAVAVSLSVGIIGMLILGFGMSLFMTDLSSDLNLSAEMAMIIGIIMGVVGIIAACLAYPLYNFTIKKERKKAAPEILRLTDELMK